DHGVPVLARVEAELVPRQLAPLPACVERVPEHVPALSRLVDPLAEVHLAPSRRLRPRERSYATRPPEPFSLARDVAELRDLGATRGELGRARERLPASATLGRL